MKATVLVRPKPGILDPQGQAVESSLRHLGFEVGDARVGRLVDIDLATENADEARAQLELDEPPDPRLGDVEAEVAQGAAHGLSLRIEDSGFRPDGNGCLHRSIRPGSMR